MDSSWNHLNLHRGARMARCEWSGVLIESYWVHIDFIWIHHGTIWFCIGARQWRDASGAGSSLNHIEFISISYGFIMEPYDSASGRANGEMRVERGPHWIILNSYWFHMDSLWNHLILHRGAPMARCEWSGVLIEAYWILIDFIWIHYGTIWICIGAHQLRDASGAGSALNHIELLLISYGFMMEPYDSVSGRTNGEMRVERGPHWIILNSYWFHMDSWWNHMILYRGAPMARCEWSGVLIESYWILIDFIWIHDGTIWFCIGAHQWRDASGAGSSLIHFEFLLFSYGFIMEP